MFPIFLSFNLNLNIANTKHTTKALSVTRLRASSADWTAEQVDIMVYVYQLMAFKYYLYKVIFASLLSNLKIIYLLTTFYC